MNAKYAQYNCVKEVDYRDGVQVVGIFQAHPTWGGVTFEKRAGATLPRDTIKEDFLIFDKFIKFHESIANFTKNISKFSILGKQEVRIPIHESWGMVGPISPRYRKFRTLWKPSIGRQCRTVF